MAASDPATPRGSAPESVPRRGVSPGSGAPAAAHAHGAPDSSARRVDLGDCVITVLRAGSLRLDGGAMFGIIPKALWSRRTPADGENRISLACNSVLVEWPRSGRRALVETGHGDKYNEKDVRIFAIDPRRWLADALRAADVGPESIEDVILTHLHFDHAGGLTRREADRVVPTLPRAAVHVQRREFDDARANFGIMTNTYREENFLPLDASGAWRLHEGAKAACEGVTLRPTPGHTRGHQSVVIAGANRTAVFVGDVMPTRQHVGRPYNMGYDLLPLDNAETKRRLLSEAAERDWLLILDHEPESPLVRVVRDGAWFALEPV
ncbi:MAG: MBL fold metallo-hydrolase [Phycisphaerae bacterium]